MHKNLPSEREQMSADLLGNRLLTLALDGIHTRSLQRFAGTLCGDPPLRQVLVSLLGGCYHASLMRQAASVAAAHPQVHAHEREAVYAATLVARLPEMVEVKGEGRSNDRPGGAPDASVLADRCAFFTASALRRLRISNPAQAAVVFSALGWTEPERLNDLHSDRLAGIVREAWAAVEAGHPAYRLPQPDQGDGAGSSFTTL